MQSEPYGGCLSSKGVQSDPYGGGVIAERPLRGVLVPKRVCRATPTGGDRPRKARVQSDPYEGCSSPKGEQSDPYGGCLQSHPYALVPKGCAERLLRRAERPQQGVLVPKGRAKRPLREVLAERPQRGVFVIEERAERPLRGVLADGPY